MSLSSLSVRLLIEWLRSVPSSILFILFFFFLRGYGESDRMWSTGEGNGKPLQYSCLENPMKNMKRQNDRILKEELPRSVRAQYATGDQWRNDFRKNEGMEQKQKQYPAVDVTGDRSKVQCCKEQYCIMSDPWIKANWKWSNKRWQEWMLTF